MPIIEKGLLLGWSPENISCRMKLEVPEIALSHTSVYSRIAADKAQGGALYKKLPRFGKRRCKGGKRKAGRFLIPNRVDISERPEVVELQSRVGDWEGDKMYGQDAHLVTLVDRKSRYTLIDKVEMVDNLNCKVQVQVTDASIVQAVKSPTKYLVVQMFGLKLVLNWRHVDVPEYLISPLTTDFRKISIGVVKGRYYISGVSFSK